MFDISAANDIDSKVFRGIILFERDEAPVPFVSDGWSYRAQNLAQNKKPKYRKMKICLSILPRPVGSESISAVAE